MIVDVPVAPGVPSVLRAVSASLAPIALLVADAVTLLGFLPLQQWGLYQDGEAVIAADSTLSIEYRAEWDISDYNTEDGGFQSYDKVQRPFDVRIQFVRGGNTADRSELLQSIDAILSTTDLFDVVTPEIVYQNVNITRENYRRESNRGLGLLKVEVSGEQVRVDATASFSSTQSPSAEASKSNGTVQVQPATNAQRIAAGLDPV